jgi:hypothetical protein
MRFFILIGGFFMKKNQLVLVGFLVLLMLIGIISCNRGTSAPGVDWKTYFPLKEGNKWTYDAHISAQGQEKDVTMIFSVTGKEKVDNVDCYALQGEVDGNKSSVEYYELSDKGLIAHKRTMGTQTFQLAPPEPMLDFPLTAGKNWKWSGKVGGADTEMNFTVAAEEDLKVPAGDFKAYKIEMNGNVKQGNLTVKSTRWFAKDVGMLKEISEIGTQLKVTAELKSKELK